MNRATIYFDGSCPLCVKEMRSLQASDKRQQIRFVDVTRACPSHLDANAVMYELHVETTEGRLLKAVEANIYVWRLLGRKPWLALLKLPVIRTLATVGYRIFAKHRQTISRVLLGRKRCEECRWD
jgi:predicted DCC family thiol-disulfide oxidoreductase YuxK